MERRPLGDCDMRYEQIGAKIGAALAREPAVEAAWLFGSATTGPAGAESDVDVGVLSSREMSLEEELTLRRRAAEAASLPDVDLVLLLRASPLLRYEATGGIRLFVRDDEKADAYERRAALRYFDTEHLRRVQQHLMRDAVERIPAVVRERLSALAGYVRNLAEVAKTPRATFLGDWRSGWLAERGLLLAAEAIFDIANHILAGALNERPADYNDTIRLLAARRVLSDELAGRLRNLGGFRNVLVHHYLAIDEATVYDHLQAALRDFPDFIAEIEAYLARGDGAPGA